MLVNSFRALDEYDRALEEDEAENRLVESLKLWKRITSLEQFSEIPFILFMNKRDIFEEKIKSFPLKEVFDDYEQFLTDNPQTASLNDTDRGTKYIEMQFQKHYSGKISFYSYATCALDTNNCVKVFDAVRDSVLAKAFGRMGFGQ
eukprot:TRINITY_DN3157_c0_g1_i11.p1 TRINITY_DN3157_c0_g1~~TRINITY_DN3157_c0_g1_i11.p1  ORF type:complete len:146 (+),score=27.12 TRINITY_DN3157_c0_g1_i11:966-1403(+)